MASTKSFIVTLLAATVLGMPTKDNRIVDPEMAVLNDRANGAILHVLQTRGGQPQTYVDRYTDAARNVAKARVTMGIDLTGFKINKAHLDNAGALLKDAKAELYNTMGAFGKDLDDLHKAQRLSQTGDPTAYLAIQRAEKDIQLSRQKVGLDHQSVQAIQGSYLNEKGLVRESYLQVKAQRKTLDRVQNAFDYVKQHGRHAKV